MKQFIPLIGVLALMVVLNGCGTSTTSYSGAEANAAVEQNLEVLEEFATSLKAEENTQSVVTQEKGTEASATEVPEESLITEEEAKEIALKDAGVTDSELTKIWTKLEMDDGVQEYEVNFIVENTEYDYDIDAKTGAIRSRDVDIEDDHLHGTATTAETIAAEQAVQNTGVTSVQKDSGNNRSNGTAATAAQTSQNTEKTPAQDAAGVTETVDSIISESAAKEIALKDAGVSESEVSSMYVKLEQDDGVQEYEVDFIVGNTEYDYDIDAKTGAIRSRDVDIENDSPRGTAATTEQSSQNTEAIPAQTESGATETAGLTAADSIISESAAKEIALKDAGALASEVSGIYVKLEQDDGVQEYDVEFYVGTREYDYEIDAKTGAIRSKDSENEHVYPHTVTESTGTASISEDEAIAIVLKKVPGATADQVRISQDKDDGIIVYEGSLKYDGVEYDFEIHGETGAILDWEEDRDD